MINNMAFMLFMSLCTPSYCMTLFVHVLNSICILRFLKKKYVHEVGTI